MRRLDWDSAHFGIEVGRADAEAPLDRELEAARSAGIACLYASAPAADLAGVARLIRRGGRLVDLRLELARGGESATSDGVRPAMPEDQAAVERAALGLASYSRFSRDGRFAEDRVDEMYRLWAQRLLEEGVVIVPVDGDGGVVAASVADGETRLDLVYVDERRAGKGLGSALVRGALAEAGAGGARVATQAGNVSALRLYEALGFRVVSSEAIVHLWLDEVS